ncbi:MAG: c-type cytochrome [Mucilaginibacter sp.]|uniref:c-type cytochrome n=1 Tax=Mucilaginibacter sp. TaxID=1882438 RepID=UPI0031AD091C
MQPKKKKTPLIVLAKISRYAICITLLTAFSLGIIIMSFNNGQVKAAQQPENKANQTSTQTIPADAWKAPAPSTIPAGKTGAMIRYGRELVMNTAKYLGPHGSVAHLSNGMNCQNCHLYAGTKLYGNDFASFMATSPKINPRSGKIISAAGRISECFQRSLAGTSPDTSKKEVQAILAYMRWVGKDVKKGQIPFGGGSERLPFMDKAANPALGKIVFMQKCKSCHGANGEGQLTADKISYTYPPLWGPHSYNDGASMFYIASLAGFVKNNMPYGATYQRPQLTNEESWNVAAFIDSQPRPHKDHHLDWTNLAKKRFDIPYGPYADSLSEKQHKYGPFKPILAAAQQKAAK